MKIDSTLEWIENILEIWNLLRTSLLQALLYLLNITGAFTKGCLMFCGSNPGGKKKNILEPTTLRLRVFYAYCSCSIYVSIVVLWQHFISDIQSHTAGTISLSWISDSQALDYFMITQWCIIDVVGTRYSIKEYLSIKNIETSHCFCGFVIVFFLLPTAKRVWPFS